MFQEVKDMLPVSGDGYDAMIIMQIKAAALDLTTSAEIVLPGVIDITREPVITVDELTQEEEMDGWTITDNSTITDELVITAIATWCMMRIGNPPNYDSLLKAYESLKGQMRISKAYTRYGEPEEDTEEETEPETPEDDGEATTE